MTFERQMDETRGATAQITCWCALIALHQEFGVGADRLNRIQDDLEKIQDVYAGKLAEGGSKVADDWLRGQIGDKGPLEFRVPVLRAPRNRKERQLRMAGDSSASIAWQMYELASIHVLGYTARPASQGCWTKAARTTPRSTDGQKRAAWSTHSPKSASAPSWR